MNLKSNEIRDPHFRELNALATTLAGDYDHCHAQLDGENAQFYRRALARTVGTFVAGLCVIMRSHAAARTSTSTEDSKELGRSAFLRGVGYRPGKNGQIEEFKLRIPMLEDLVLAFRWYAKAWQSNYQLDKSDDGDWPALTATISIRHRSMHPQCAADLIISDSEAVQLKRAFCYVHNSLMWLYAGSQLLCEAHALLKNDRERRTVRYDGDLNPP